MIRAARSSAPALARNNDSDSGVAVLQPFSFLISAGLADQAQRLDFADGRLNWRSVEVNAYFA